MALVTYPLNNIEYSAEDAELFHVTRTSGIYANNSFDYSITGADNNIVIGTGIGWIKNSEFSGKVIAQKEAISLDMGLPDSVYPRIDAIVIQFDSNRNETNIVVKNGTAASNPVAPSVVQNESVYELHLYHVRREAGSLYITPSNITDLRLNSSYCGLMADSVTNIDTTAIEKQVSDLIKSLQDEISSVKDGSAYLLRNGSTNMTGNLPMGGHKVTGLGTPTADGDAVPLWYANQNFAPAGYGLGEAVQFSISEVNSIARPGWYYCSDNGKIGSHTSNRWWMHVKAYGAGDAFASQEMYSFTGSKCLKFERHKINGAWGAWASADSMTRVKLWENASLESTFDAQKIALDLSGYDGVEVVTYADQTTGVYLNSGFIRKGLTGVFQYSYATQSYRLTRTFMVDDTGVEFHAATNTGTLPVNKLAKPFIIYGIKGVIE